MKRFQVIVTRDTTESKTVTVNAVDAASAEAKALECAMSDPHHGWSLDDGNFQHPYTNGAEELGPTRCKTRADLLSRPAWQHMGVDSAGNPAVWLNYYACDLDHHIASWSDQWSCQCEDDCPVCGMSYEPDSEWIGPTDEAEIALWESLPDAG